MTLRIGTSGWQYPHWRERYYPHDLRQRDWLRAYAADFDCVEVNNTFYGLPDAEAFARWRDSVSDGFVFALKFSRYATHIKRLRDPEQPVALFLERASHLHDRLGPILIQLPPTLQADVDRLRRCLTSFPSRVRLAVEFRHPSWFTDSVRRLLADVGAALCLSDRRGIQEPEWRTADWGYVRFHEGTAQPPSCYADKELREWASRIQRLWEPHADVYAFFNNDAYACALRDAGRLGAEAQQVGLDASRTGAVVQV